MKQKLWSIFAIFVLALTACNGNDNNGTDDTNNNAQPTRYNQTNDGTNTVDPNMERTGFEGNNRFGDNNRVNDENDTNYNGNTNDQYDVAEEAAERIANEIPEIERAYVLTTENNAYVAAQLDAENNNNGTNENNGRTNRNGEVNQRNVNNRNNNGDEGEELTEEVKEQIADIVKSVDNDINNVFVSTNPDFYNLTTNYVDDVDNGRPIRGFFDQFGNMINRLFPENK